MTPASSDTPSQSQDPNNKPRGLRDEPLLHFIVLAGLVFVIQAIWSGDQRDLIAIDRATQDYLIKRRQELMLRPLAEAEKKQVIDNFVEDELLVREARKRGLDNSARVRRLLIQNMRFFFLNQHSKPTEQELRTFFEANRGRFETPPSITYDHVFFKHRSHLPSDTRQRLNAGADHKKVGDFNLSFGRKLYGVDRNRVVKTFGPVVAREVLAIADDEWHGPFESPLGRHFLRIAERKPPSRPEFAAAKRWVEAEWRRVRQRAVLDRELAKIRQGYRIEIETPPMGGG